jgi:hypothetical protein
MRRLCPLLEKHFGLATHQTAGLTLEALRSCRRCCFLSGGHFRVDAYEFPQAPLILELHDAVNQSKERIVFAAPYVLSGFPLCTALARKDVAAKHALATEFLES